MNLTSILCVLKRPTFLTLLAFVFPYVMWRMGRRRKLHHGEKWQKTAVENVGSRGLRSTTIYMLMKTRNASPPHTPPLFDLIWNFVTFLWYVILPPVFFSLLLAIKTLWNSQNKEGQRTSCETALCSQWVCWGGKSTSEVIECRSRKGSRQIQPWILKKIEKDCWRCTPGLRILP